MINLLKQVFGVVKVKELMRTPAVTIGEDEDLSWAMMKFSNHSISHLIAVDQADRVSGILSHKYVYRTQSPRKIMGQEALYTSDMILDGDSYYYKESLDKYYVRQVMKKSPPTIRPGQGIDDAIKILADRKIGCIPVVDKDKHAIGIITEREIIEYAAKALKEGS